MEKPQEQIELTYWDIKGLGEFIRLTLAYLRLPYIENNLGSSEGWRELAGSLLGSGLHFPNLPHIKDGDLYFSESQIIPIYLCKRFGRLDLVGGSNLVDQTRISEVMGVLADMRMEVLKFILSPEYKENITEAVKDGSKFQRKLQFLSRFLGNKDYFINNSFTVLDIFAGYSFYLIGNVTKSATTKNAFDDFPTLKAHVQRVFEQPGIKEHVASDEWKRPLFPPQYVNWVKEE